MNTRNDRRGYRRRGSDLLVTDVILPAKTDQSDARFNKDVGKLQENNESGHDTNTSRIIGEHKVTAYCGLVVVQKPPIEDCVFGTKSKKRRKRKERVNKYSNTDPKVSDSDSQGNVSESWEEKILKANIEKKIQNYENWVELQQEQNFRRQRCLEKESLKELLSLAAQWSTFQDKRNHS